MTDTTHLQAIDIAAYDVPCLGTWRCWDGTVPTFSSAAMEATRGVNSGLDLAAGNSHTRFRFKSLGPDFSFSGKYFGATDADLA